MRVFRHNRESYERHVVAALARLDRQLRRLHRPNIQQGPDGHVLYGCTGCDDGETWPCPTIQVLDETFASLDGNVELDTWQDLRRFTIVVACCLGVFHVIGTLVWIFGSDVDLLAIAIMWDVVVATLALLSYGVHRFLNRVDERKRTVEEGTGRPVRSIYRAGRGHERDA